MLTALVLAIALGLGLLGAWGTARLLARLELDASECVALTLALFPAALGLAAFAGLLAGRPGPLFPSALCVVLGVLGAICGEAPPPAPRPTAVARGSQHTSRRCSSPSPPPWGGGRGVGLSSVLLAVGLFGAGTLGTVLLTPLSAGALRVGDWVAHWFLVLVYLGQPLPDLRTFTNRVGDFGVISRPPLYNLEGGLLVGALDGQFWPFQLLSPLLSLVVVAAGVLWARAVGGPRVARLVAALVGLSPFLIQNGAYPWSKMVAAGLVLLFLYLIRAAVLARRPTRARQTFVLAALCAGLGYVTHQTTLFYTLPTLLWLAWRRPRPLFRRPGSWTLGTWALGGLVGLAAFAPWQGWVLMTYGLRALLDANPASFNADVSESLGDWLLKGGVAALGTLVPLPALGALARGSLPSLDHLLRIQLALLTGALGISGCWLLVQTTLRRRGEVTRLLGCPPWLALVVLCGFLGQVMLQPNWHDTGDAAESMTPIVVLGLAYVAREALRLGPGARRLFFILVLAEVGVYLGLWLWWSFGSAWTRDVNVVLGMRYELGHVRMLWAPAVPLGAALLACGLGGSALLLWRSLAPAFPLSRAS